MRNKKINFMAKFDITIRVDSDNEQQAHEIADALQDASNKVTGKELVGMLKILKKNPSYIKMAKMASKLA